MMMPLYVLIAACGQPALLRRTLTSLAACQKPANYSGVIVVENGLQAGLDAIVAEFAAEHRFQYAYSEPPNKSVALNRALAQIDGAFVIFTDDDVQVPRETLVEYSRVAAGCNRAAGDRSGEFYGGPIVPDYEGLQPADWLLPLLPRSAAGWKLETTEKTRITKPEFIGPNFAAFAADVLRVGGFDTRLGPGGHMPSPGEDTEIQERLLASGVFGYYLPGAAMRHFVRASGTTPEFAVHRAERNGVYWGISQARKRNFFPRRWLKTHGQALNDRLRIAQWRQSGEEAAMTRAACLEARWRGRWQGIRLGWKWDAPRSLAGAKLGLEDADLTASPRRAGKNMVPASNCSR
jgi:glycosyltransferase involved in cell wall biosynthesis